MVFLGLSGGNVAQRVFCKSYRLLGLKHGELVAHYVSHPWYNNTLTKALSTLMCKSMSSDHIWTSSLDAKNVYDFSI